MILDFFIAVFGGLYYGGKILSDKSRTNSARRSYNAEVARRDAWKGSVTDPGLEREVDDYITNHREEAEEIFYSYFPDFSLNKDAWTFCWHLNSVEDGAQRLALKRILMAEYGKVPRGDTIPGTFDSWVRSHNKDQDAWERQWHFMQVWDSILVSHGVEPMMYTLRVRSSSSLYEEDKKRATPVMNGYNDATPHWGIYYWPSGA